jgi:hypothetical protein
MPLKEHSMGIFPAYLVKGLPSLQQLAVVYIWNRKLAGKKINYAELSRDCCSTTPTIKKAIEALFEADILRGTMEDLGISASFIPNYAIPAPPKKKAKKLPEWTFSAILVWAKSRGAVSPKDMHRCLHSTITLYGIDDTLMALDGYARKGEMPYKTLECFGKEAKLWIDNEKKIAQSTK